MTPNVLEYLDYRLYLADLCESLKENDPKFSCREFSRMAGSTSPNFLQLIKQRKLHLSDKSINSLAGSINISSREKRYLQTLAAFDHAKTHEEKDRFFRRIVSAREYGKFKQLQQDQYRYLSHWYMPVIRELVVSPQYTGDPAWIAARIVPAISESKAGKGVAMLSQLGLIRKNPGTGAWEQCDRVVTTPPEVISVAVVRYYRDIFALARDSMERFPGSMRDIRGITVGISEKTYGVMKSRMESFWKEMMAMANEPQEVEKVYHIGLQLFPLSQVIQK